MTVRSNNWFRSPSSQVLRMSRRQALKSMAATTGYVIATAVGCGGGGQATTPPNARTPPSLPVGVLTLLRRI